MLITIGSCDKTVGDEGDVTIETKQGTLQGVVKFARNGEQYHAYLGIPYAQPPINELRWKTTKPVPKWEGVRNATNHPALCIQHYVNNPKEIIGKKDFNNICIKMCKILIIKIGNFIYFL